MNAIEEIKMKMFANIKIINIKKFYIYYIL